MEAFNEIPDDMTYQEYLGTLDPSLRELIEQEDERIVAEIIEEWNMEWRKRKRVYRLSGIEEARWKGECASEMKLEFGRLRRNPYPKGRRHDVWQREYERYDDCHDDWERRRE